MRDKPSQLGLLLPNDHIGGRAHHGRFSTLVTYKNSDTQTTPQTNSECLQAGPGNQYF